MSDTQITNDTFNDDDKWASRRDELIARLQVLFSTLLPDMSGPSSVLYQIGLAFQDLGEEVEASGAFERAIVADPEFVDAYLALAVVLGNRREHGQRRLVIDAALAKFPNNPKVRLRCGWVAHSHNEFLRAAEHFKAAYMLDPTERDAVIGMAMIAEFAGRVEDAMKLWRAAYPTGFVWKSRYVGSTKPIRVLEITSTLTGNVRLGLALDPREFQWTHLTSELYHSEMKIPEHDVVFQGIGDADLCVEGLKCARDVIAKLGEPVFNPIESVEKTGRVENSERLREIAGVRTPLTKLLSRRTLAAPYAVRQLKKMGYTWPLLLRAPGYQTGHHFMKIDTPAELPNALRHLPGDELLALSFMDIHRVDGTYCKYRVMSIDGKLYPLHLAISKNWKVHYLSSDMAENAEFRAEEQRFLEDMHGTLGPKVMDTLTRMFQFLALDYAGADFCIDQNGNVLVYEANATMAMIPPGKDGRWDYRRPAISTAMEAVRKMIRDRVDLLKMMSPQQGSNVPGNPS